MEKTLGGDRLGSGNKMKVQLHGYERSTHNLSYLWRSTMASGPLVPFLSEVALPGDTFDIDLACEILTHPTIGPLFGSYKVQLDIFQAPIRLYNALLHNNAIGIGLKMNQVKLPTFSLTCKPVTNAQLEALPDIDNSQINPSSILSYLGIKGAGINYDAVDHTRDFNAIPLLAYWEIYKNYYANKQEEIGAVLHTPAQNINKNITKIQIQFGVGGPTFDLGVYPAATPVTINGSTYLYQIFTPPMTDINDIIFNTSIGDKSWSDLCGPTYHSITGGITAQVNTLFMGVLIYNWRYRTSTDMNTGKPAIATFPLSNIDDMRNAILANHSTTSAFNLNTDGNMIPYQWVWEQPNNTPNVLSSQEGLALKTYQSDLFNNWLQTEWIDGVGGITEITKIDTTSGGFTIDTLILSRKVYDMLNRIAISGGTYDDWLDAVYAHDRYTRCESPMYMGGLIKELVFQQVVSNTATNSQPLGTLAGRGTLSSKHKGGHVIIKVDEPSYIIGLISLTPRLDYSQGNKWDCHLQTMDDLHKPALDEIGFQELITEQMAWWDTYYIGGNWFKNSAGKQPAWINYMTNVNQVKGNFAIASNEMFMTLNRRYEWSDVTGTTSMIKDLTTYIDPSKYNNIFAETQLDAQNFWAQIAVNMIARRKMSAKVIPNL